MQISAIHFLAQVQLLSSRFLKGSSQLLFKIPLSRQIGQRTKGIDDILLAKFAPYSRTAKASPESGC